MGVVLSWKMVRFWLNLAYYIIKHANYARSTNQNEFCTADLYLWWLRAPFFELTFWSHPLFAKILYALSEKKLLAKWNVFKKLRVVKFIACGLLGYKFRSAEAWFKEKKLPKALRTNRQISQVTETHSHSRLSRFMRIAFLVVLIKICFSLLHDSYFFRFKK